MALPFPLTATRDGSTSSPFPPAIGRGKGWLMRLVLLVCLCSMTLVGSQSTGLSQGLDIEGKPSLRLKVKQGEATVLMEGMALVEAQDGGYLVMQADGRLSQVQPEEILEKEILESPLSLQSVDQAKASLEKEMPGFRVHTTKHYVICYDTSDAYAKWTGIQFEALLARFIKFWGTRGIRLKEPELPLVALVFRSKESYETYAVKEIGESAKAMLGYYNLMTNRITTFDLTGVESQSRPGERVNRSQRVEEILSQPNAERTVATILHEAVHQVAYNTGLQTRLAPNPFWVSEGLAIYFETPDFSNGGKGTIGAPNRINLQRFAAYLPKREGDGNGLIQLLCDDNRFRNAEQADAYGESWALNFYLLKKKKDKYVKYLQHLAKMKPLEVQTAKDRVEDFKRFFGDIRKLDVDFLQFMQSQPF